MTLAISKNKQRKRIALRLFTIGNCNSSFLIEGSENVEAKLILGYYVAQIGMCF